VPKNYDIALDKTKNDQLAKIGKEVVNNIK
jgi:hypothetical protein